MEVSIVIEAQQGLNWPRWKRLVAEIDALSFAALYRTDHLTEPKPPDTDALELIVSLTYLASHTERVRFGSLVAPLSFRDPRMLAWQAAAIDDLSGGRLVLGVGAGWQEREHEVFGYSLGDMRTRMARFGEGLDVITRLLRSDGPATYRGEFFQISEAMLLPRPERPSGPPLLVGGSGPRRTLPFVARYADIWNSLRTSPDGFRENSALLDNLLRAAGRDPGKVKRTLFTGVFFAHDAADLERVLGRMRDAVPDGADKSTAEILEAQRARNTIIGTPEMIAEQVAAFRAAGVEELMLRWTEMDDIHRLRAFSEVVVHFQ